MRIIIDTEEQYLPAFREVAKLVRAKVKTDKTAQSPARTIKSALSESRSTAKPGEKIADLLEKLNFSEDAIDDLETLRKRAWPGKE